MRLKHLLKPTPKKLRRLGNAMAALSTGAVIPAFLSDNRALALAIFVVGAIGKFLSSLFSEEYDVKKNNDDDDHS